MKLSSGLSEPRHDKTNEMSIRPVGSEFSLCAQWVAKNPRFLHADSEDSSQADLSLRWAHTHFVGFVMPQLIFVLCAMHR